MPKLMHLMTDRQIEVGIRQKANAIAERDASLTNLQRLGLSSSNLYGDPAHQAQINNAHRRLSYAITEHERLWNEMQRRQAQSAQGTKVPVFTNDVSPPNTPKPSGQRRLKD